MNRAFVRRIAAVVSAATVAAFAMSGMGPSAQGTRPAAPAKVAGTKGATFDATACLGCHAPVKALYDSGKHKGVGCNTCHGGTAAHLADSSKRPATKTDLANCGGCHQNQYQSYAQMDWNRTARFEKKLLASQSV